MTQLSRLTVRLGNITGQDSLLEDLLEDAKDIICNIRNSDIVESKYLGVQIRMAVELYNKIGVEGQTGHSENGIGRSYEKADVSDSLIKQITPIAKSVYGDVRVII